MDHLVEGIAVRVLVGECAGTGMGCGAGRRIDAPVFELDRAAGAAVLRICIGDEPKRAQFTACVDGVGSGVLSETFIIPSGCRDSSRGWNTEAWMSMDSQSGKVAKTLRERTLG